MRTLHHESGQEQMIMLSNHLRMPFLFLDQFARHDECSSYPDSIEEEGRTDGECVLVCLVGCRFAG